MGTHTLVKANRRLFVSGRISDEFIQSDFDYLLDGEGSLTLFWNRALGNPDRIIQNLIEPSGEIFSGQQSSHDGRNAEEARR